MDIDAVIDQNAIDHLFQVFAVGVCLIFFWFMESVYRLDKRWLIPIVIFPPSIFIFIMMNWEESRGKCFFAALLLVVMIIVGGLVGHSFFAQMFAFVELAAFWPFFAYAYLSNKAVMLLGHHHAG